MMKIPIDTNILDKYKLSLEQYIVLLTSFYNIDCTKVQEELEAKNLVDKNLFNGYPPILSDNTKDLVVRIMVESDEKVQNSYIKDFKKLATTLQSYYPDGIKPGKTYPLRGDADIIALRLMILIAKYDFSFTEEEAIAAVKEYVSSFQPPYRYMHSLGNFILFTRNDVESIFMTIIENNRT